MRSLIARSMRSRPTRYWFSSSSPTERTRRLPRLSMSSISPRPSRRPTRVLQHLQHVFLADDANIVGAVEFEADVHLHAADRRQVVALLIEEQALEHRLGRFDRRRLARTHDAVDVEQGVFADGVLVHPQGVADVGADRDVVDVEHVDGGEALLFQRGDRGRRRVRRRLRRRFRRSPALIEVRTGNARRQPRVVRGTGRPGPAARLDPDPPLAPAHDRSSLRGGRAPRRPRDP